MGIHKFMRNYRLLYTPVMLLGLCIVAASLSCSRSSDFRSVEGIVWNTSYHISFRGPQSLEDSIGRVLNEVEMSLSVFNPNSLVSLVNASDSAVTVDSAFEKVYELSRKVNVASDGMYDPTLSPLITAWGFGKGHSVVPRDTMNVDSILRFVGIPKTHLQKHRIVKDDPRIQFNFSSVAKGYGCDAIGEMFERNGVHDYMIEIGGEVKVAGYSPRGSLWNISVDRPILSDSLEIHESQEIIAVSGVGVASSGNYRNFHRDGERTFAHTISPVTGRPVQTDVISVTVVAPTAMEADAFATACMAAGSEKSAEMSRRFNLPVMMVLSDSSVWTNPMFNRLVANPESHMRKK